MCGTMPGRPGDERTKHLFYIYESPVTDYAYIGDLHPYYELMSDQDLQAELERLRKENEALKKGAAKGVSLKVSEKGGVSVYGLGRFPITLYKEQWTKLIEMSDTIREFIAAHESELKSKA